jgi:hypothetical protein
VWTRYARVYRSAWSKTLSRTKGRRRNLGDLLIQHLIQQIYYHQRNFNPANKMQERLRVVDPDTLAMLNEIHGESGVRGAFDHWLKEQKTPPDPYFLAVA